MRITNNDRVVLDAIAEMIEEKERTRKAEKAIFDTKVKELVAQGIDKQVAKAMVKAFASCGL